MVIIIFLERMFQIIIFIEIINFETRSYELFSMASLWSDSWTPNGCGRKDGFGHIDISQLSITKCVNGGFPSKKDGLFLPTFQMHPLTFLPNFKEFRISIRYLCIFLENLYILKKNQIWNAIKLNFYKS